MSKVPDTSSDVISSSEIADRYATIAAGFSARIEQCPPDGWSLSTPCPDWTVRGILGHVVGVHRRVLATLWGGEAEAPGLDDDLDAAWRDVTEALQAALRDPAQATTSVTTRYGEMPFEDLVSRMICSDTLVHTWDIARATGQDERLDPAVVEIAWRWMEPAGDRLRVAGGFGPAIAAPVDADTQTQLLCFLGRDAATT